MYIYYFLLNTKIGKHVEFKKRENIKINCTKYFFFCLLVENSIRNELNITHYARLTFYFLT